jgi:hypothetical protein
VSTTISSGDPVRCPVCSTIYDDERTVCPSCGSIVPLEVFWRRSVRFVRNLFGKSPRPRAATVLWLLALSPILIVPPLIAIGLALGPSGRTKSSFHRLAIVTISILNILLSVTILVLARHQLVGLALSGWHALTQHRWTEPPPSDNPIQRI